MIDKNKDVPNFILVIGLDMNIVGQKTFLMVKLMLEKLIQSNEGTFKVFFCVQLPSVSLETLFVHTKKMFEFDFSMFSSLWTWFQVDRIE
jgi:hypothetical protein